MLLLHFLTVNKGRVHRSITMVMKATSVSIAKASELKIGGENS